MVAATGLQPHATVDRVGSGCDNDDAEPATAFAQPPCECEPVLARETNVEQDKSRQFTVDEPAQCRPAVDAAHTEIVLAEVLDQQLALSGLVLDHDDMWPVIRHSGLARIRTHSKNCRPCPVRQGPGASGRTSATEAPFRPPVCEGNFWRLVFDGARCCDRCSLTPRRQTAHAAVRAFLFWGPK